MSDDLHLHPLADSPVITEMALALRTTPRDVMYHDGDYDRPRDEFAGACRVEYFKRAVADGAETQRLLSADMSAEDMDGFAIAKIIGTWLRGLDAADERNTPEQFVRRHYEELAKQRGMSPEEVDVAVAATLATLQGGA